MVYILLNIIVAVSFIYFTHLVDSKVKTESFEVSTFSIALLLTCAEAILLLVTIIFKNYWLDAVTTQFMRIVFCLDGLMFIAVTFGFISLSAHTKKFFPRLVEFLLALGVIVLVWTRFSQIDITYDKGIFIQSEYLFGPEARRFFPWTWVTVYTMVYRYILPVVGLLIMAIKSEERATQLQKSQAIVILAALILMWFCSFVINFISKAIPAFSMLYMFAYLFMYVVIYSALVQASVPSGKTLFIFVLKILISYILPSAILGLVCMFLQPLYNNFQVTYIIIISLVTVVCVIYAYWIGDVISNSSRFYTADYGSQLERDLTTIDYATGEMDFIASRMFDIVKNNTETASMNVYILSSQTELEIAYSSNNTSDKISVNTPGFDALLNINRSIVFQSQLEKEHDLADVRTQLQKFFDKYKCDVLIILNEGHNIFGVITLGCKANGDHFKEYDYNVFEKLYSHFFVFGYYMRNISNKEIIGVVNREIRMSSQIITSIQENIDQVRNDKIDTGYLMVPAHNIGGEFIDMIRLTATRHLFVVGDLSGKGIAASMNMVILKSIIRTYLAETHDFKELVVKTNSFIRDSLLKGTIFAGLFALVDFETDTMYYINCGIPALMMYTQVYNNVIEIQGSGHFLGFVKDISPYISVKTTKLNRGDIILACTDGLVQSHSLRGEQYGKERIQQDILDNSTYNAQRMAQFTFDDLIKFMSKEMEDDVSILVLKYESKNEVEEYADVKEEEKEKEVPEEIQVPDYVEESSSEIIEEPSDTIQQDISIDLPETLEDNDLKVPVEDFSSEELPGEIEEKSFELGGVIAAEESDLPKSIPEEATSMESQPAANIPQTDIPAGEEIPDLSDLDQMLKEAGL